MRAPHSTQREFAREVLANNTPHVSIALWFESEVHSHLYGSALDEKWPETSSPSVQEQQSAIAAAKAPDADPLLLLPQTFCSHQAERR